MYISFSVVQSDINLFEQLNSNLTLHSGRFSINQNYSPFALLIWGIPCAVVFSLSPCQTLTMDGSSDEGV